MINRKANSRNQFKIFVKEKGIFRYKEEKNPDGDAPSRSNEPKKPLKYYLGRYLQEFKDQKTRLAMVMFLGVISTIIGAAFPWTSKVMIDYVLPQKNIVLLFSTCIFLFVIGLMRNFISLFQDYLSQVLSGRFSNNLKTRLMGHLQTLPLVELQRLKTGGIITRLQEDTEGAGNLIHNGLLSPFNALFMLVVSMSSLLLISWKTTIVCIVFGTLMCGLAYLFFYLMRPFQRSLCQERSLINASLTESFGGIQVVKSFGREKTVSMDYVTNINLLWRKSMYSMIAGMFVHRSIWTIHLTAETCIWLVGGYFFINGTLTLGGVVLFISFLMWIFQPIFMIMASLSETQRSIACTERTIDLLDMKPDIFDREGASEMKSFEKGFQFHGVSFRYPDGTQALDNVDLLIPKGKITALVGHSGGGKTTLTNLVLRFYDVKEGRITLDDKDIKDITLHSYRNLMSLVLQDVFLFDGTVRENIMFGKRNASVEEVQNVARIAHCTEFVEKMKDKFETIIGERGVKLSGGQKQRVALARAIIANPQLLILDEATSNLDSESEGLIQDALRHMFKNRTSLVIAHRLSTIMDADNIVVIEKGKIAEQGTHPELLEKKGKYYEMYSKQMEKMKKLENIWSDSATDEDDKIQNKGANTE